MNGLIVLLLGLLAWVVAGALSVLLGGGLLGVVVGVIIGGAYGWFVLGPWIAGRME